MSDWIQAKDETVREDSDAVIRRMAAKIERLRAALENARRDIFLLAPKIGSRSPLRKAAENAAGRIETILNEQTAIQRRDR